MADVIVSDCGNWDVTWPYPQAHYGSYYTLAFALVDSEDDCSAGLPSGDSHLVLYELINSSNIWTAVAYYDFGVLTYIDQIDITDFGRFYVATVFGYNGSTATITSAIRNPGDSSPYHTTLPTIKCPQFITGCNFNGQAVIGGIISTSSPWDNLNLSGVAWSGIGNFDFRPEETGHVAGFRQMPWENEGKGIVYKVKALGKGVMVYGDGGSAFIYPSSEPTFTYGLEELNIAGVSSGNHVAGDNKIQCFIDTNYDLCMIDKGIKLEKLGYREFMRDLVTYSPGAGDGRTLMSYVPERRCFYISNGNECYILTEFGLYSTDQMVTSAGDYKGTLCGFWRDGADEEIRLTTDSLDFRSQGRKIVESIEVGGFYQHGSDYDLSASVDFKNDYKENSFESLSWRILNPNGMASIKVDARNFRIKLKGTTYKNATFDLSSLVAKLKYTDKRNIRGRLDVSQTYVRPGN